MRRLLALGFGIWAGATILLRLAGQFIIPASPAATVALYALSIPAMAWVARSACRRVALSRAEWPTGAIALAAPTLLLDPFTSAFFADAFPNMRPELAGAFGGWMLCCVAGALLGAARK